MVGSVLIVTVFYVVTIFVATSTLGSEALDGFGETAMVEVGREFFGTGGAVAILLAGLLATFSSANASILSSSRAIYALIDILPRLKTRESTKWIFRLRVSSVLKYAFAWNVNGRHRVVTNGVLFSAYSPVNGAFLPAYSGRRRQLAIQPAR